MTGGAFGSMFAQQFHLSAAERKTLLVAGAAAGMSAVFAAPVAAVLLAVELLLFEWKPRSFIPVAFPDEPLHAALTKMLNRDIGRLPVVERNNPARVVGYLGRAALLSARLRLHEEENVRGRG